MKLSRIGRASMALAASVALGLGMTACGGGTVGFMWVVGTQLTATSTSSIAGFKIDNFTGNLTNIPRSPFNSTGVNPATIVVRSGGRYVYVINSGTTDAATGKPVGDGNVSAFSVGGDGVLTFQESYPTQGGSPVWAASDNSGGFLYVLDRLAPAGSSYNAAGLGDVTVFSIASDTGRLALVTNQQVKDENNINLNYFPVGPDPRMLRVQANNCMFVLDKTQTADPYPNSLFPYQIQTGGQLITTVTGNVAVSPNHLTSVTNGSGAYLYLTDVGATNADGTPQGSGQIYAYSVGTACALNAVVGSPFNNVTGTEQNPVWTVTEARNSKFVYVLNQSNSNSTQANSSISVFSLDSQGRLVDPGLGTINPFSVGSGPTCMVEDPTNKYLYTSNSVDGTVTGSAIQLSTGALSPLQRGSTFSAVTHATCLAVSGAVS